MIQLVVDTMKQVLVTSQRSKVNDTTPAVLLSRENKNVLFFACRALANLAYPRERQEWSSKIDQDASACLILEAGGLDVLLKLLQQQQQPDATNMVEIQHKALAALVNLSATYPGAKAILEHNGIPVVLSYLSNPTLYGNHAEIQEFSLSILAQLMLLYNTKIKSGDQKDLQDRHEILSLTLHSMKRHRDKPKIQERGSSLLVPLFHQLPIPTPTDKSDRHDDNNEKEEVDLVSSTILLLLEVLETHKTHKSTMHCALIALQNLSSFDFSPTQMSVMTGGVGVVLGLVQESLREVKKKKDHVLDDTKEAKIVAQFPLKKHEQPMVQLLHACCTLSNMSFDFVNGIPAVGDAGGHETLADTLLLLWNSGNQEILLQTNHISKSECAMIQDAVLATLSRLASQVSYRQVIVAACGGESTAIVVKTMQQNISDVWIVKHGIALLGNLSATGSCQSAIVLKYHGLEIILHSMMTHSDDEELMNFATGAIANLLKDSTAQQMILCPFLPEEHKEHPMPGYEVIFSSMTKHAENEEILMRAFKCILHMAEIGGETMGFELVKRIVTAVRAMSQKYYANLRVIIQAYKVLERICGDDIGAEAFAQCDGAVAAVLGSVASSNTKEVLAALLLIKIALPNKTTQTFFLFQSGFSTVVKAIKDHSTGNNPTSSKVLLYGIAVLKKLWQNPQSHWTITCSDYGLLPMLEERLQSHAQLLPNSMEEKQVTAIVNVLDYLSRIAADKPPSFWSPSPELVKAIIRTMEVHNDTSPPILQLGIRFFAHLSVHEEHLTMLAQVGAIQCILTIRLVSSSKVCDAIINLSRDLSCLVEMEKYQVMIKLLALMQLNEDNSQTVASALLTMVNVFRVIKSKDEGVFQRMKSEFCENNGRLIVANLRNKHNTGAGVEYHAENLMSFLFSSVNSGG
uniref:Vacuolar protein 8 n=1 Tax=Entomoneis paludosa TaxID=265537 RepID=A0A7S2VDC0_9STRA